MALEYQSPNGNVGMTGDALFEKLLDEQHKERPIYRQKRCLPAEWSPQSAIQLTWPHADTDWNYMLSEVVACFTRLAYEIAIRQPLLIVCPNVANVKQHLSHQLPQQALSNIQFFTCPSNDTWARDHGFLTVLGPEGAELLDFRFAGWGGKFEASLDNSINRQLSEANVLRGRYIDCLDFELEGGGIESDGMGTILTTTDCLLNPNRRHSGDAVPVADKTQVEILLQDRLGAERVLWLSKGYLAGDDTDSHIDTLARFCPDNTIVYVKCNDETDEHYSALCAMERELQDFRTKEGNPYRLLPLPHADACFDEEGQRLPATYANFLILNRAVLMPTYAQPEKDTQALRVLQTAFPQHEIVGVDCRALIQQHGSLHCVTMQYPRGVLRTTEE